MLKQHESADINHTLEKLFRLQRLGIKVGLEHTYELLNRCDVSYDAVPNTAALNFTS